MIDRRCVPRHKDLTGKVFNRWTVIKSVPKNHEKYRKHALYFCTCTCGQSRIVSAIHLRSGRSKSCGCIRLETITKRPYESLYNRLVRRNDNVRITYEEFCEFTKCKTCHYCSAEIKWTTSGRIAPRGGSHGYYLDRKDNLLGYYKENCVVCCGNCNRTKGDRFTYEEFMLLSPALKTIQEAKESL